MKLFIKLVFSLVTLTLLQPGQMVAEQTIDLDGFVWWDCDSATARFRFSLADGVQAADGDYRVVFNERWSSGALNTNAPGFTILNGQVTADGSTTGYAGITSSNNDGLECTATCEGIVYKCAFYNSGCQDWQPVGSVVNNPAYSLEYHYIDHQYSATNVNFDVQITVQVGPGSCSASTQPGTSTPELNSLDWSIGLGSAEFGNSHGSLRILSAQARPELSSPTFLIPAAPSPGFDRRLVQNAVRQVLTPTALVQVSNDTEDGSPYLYKIDFLSRPNPLVDTNGFYLTNGATLIKEVTVQNPNGSTNYNTLRITEVAGSITNQIQYVYDPSNLLWTLTLPGNLSKQTLQTVSSNATQLVTRKSIFKPGTPDQLVYREQNTYTNFTYVDGGVTVLTGFSFLIQKVIDPDGAQLTTAYDYYWDPTETYRFKKLKQKVNPDGSWVRYDYGSDFDKTVYPGQ